MVMRPAQLDGKTTFVEEVSTPDPGLPTGVGAPALEP